MNLNNNASFNLLERSLDAVALNQRVIANNIANADTPHFKRSKVNFEQLLQKEMNSQYIQGFRTNAKHLPFAHGISLGTPTVETDERTAMNNNQNNVDIDAEMAFLAKNQMTYDFLVQRINGKLKNVRTAIGGNR